MANNQIDPQQLQQLPQQQPQTGLFPNPLLQAQPATPNLDEATARSMQMGQEIVGQEMAKRQALAAQLEQARQQQAGITTAYHPNFQPVTGHGFLHGLGAALGDIGKGALQGLAATSPGQAVQGQVYHPERLEYSRLANQIAQIQQQMGPETGAMQAGAQLSERPMGALGQYYRGVGSMGEAEAAKERAGAAMMDAKTRAEVDRQRVQLEAQANQIRQDLGNKKITAEQARTQMMKYVADSTNSMRQNVASMFTDQRQAAVETEAAETQYKTEADHLLQTILGIGPSTPTQPAIKKGSSLKPQGSNDRQGKGTVTLTSEGKRYNIPRHLIGAFKKDHPDAR